MEPPPARVPHPGLTTLPHTLPTPTLPYPTPPFPTQIGVGADFGLGWIPPGIEAAEALLVSFFVGYLDHEPWLERYLDFMSVQATLMTGAPIPWARRVGCVSRGGGGGCAG